MEQEFYIPKNFKETELVDSSVYNYFQQRSWSCWSLFNPLLLKTIQAIRDLYGTQIVINNWQVGGLYKFRGFRTNSCPVGEAYSGHKRGCAADMDIGGQLARSVIQEILDHPWNEAFKYITFVEINVDWVHVEVSNLDKIKYGIQKIDPSKLEGMYAIKEDL